MYIFSVVSISSFEYPGPQKFSPLTEFWELPGSWVACTASAAPTETPESSGQDEINDCLKGDTLLESTREERFEVSDNIAQLLIPEFRDEVLEEELKAMEALPVFGVAYFQHDFLESIVENRKPSPSVNLLGPIPALMEKKAGRFRQLAILTSENRPALHKELDRLVRLAEQSEHSKRVRWSIDVDPVDLF